MKLKLTKRERLLFIIFLICLAAATIYFVAIKPQLDMVIKLERQIQKYSAEISDIKSKASLDNPIFDEYEKLNEKTRSLVKRYYPEIIQEKFILLLNDKANKTNINVRSINFQAPEFVVLKVEKNAKGIEESELEAIVNQMHNFKAASETDKQQETVNEEQSLKVEKMTATISLQGGYSQIYDFVKEIELEKRSIVLTYVNMQSDGSDNISCELILDFYAVPKPFEQDDEYLRWNIEGQYGRENPFK